MRTVHDHIKRRTAESPTFRDALALARAELRLGDQVAAIRRRRGLTQAALAAALNAPQSSVARLEGADRTPTVETLLKYANVLNCRFEIGPNFSVAVADLTAVAGTVFHFDLNFNNAAPQQLPLIPAGALTIGERRVGTIATSGVDVAAVARIEPPAPGSPGPSPSTSVADPTGALPEFALAA